MPKSIVLIQGHPDPEGNRFCHALGTSYLNGARGNKHETQVIDVAQIDFPIIRTKEDFETGNVPSEIIECQKIIQWANHLVVIYPLWLGTMPALLKAFFEQVFRYEFALSSKVGNGFPKGLLQGKSARIAITMGMPAFIYRWFFGAHSLKSLERNVLKLSGIKPIRDSLIGNIDSPDNRDREKWLHELYDLGREGN
ncbi:MAG: NAD(P)H-dependent oxidoreductase [Candidatus Nitronauta litoralis]|uniref:NAD(P)H-dependent oxidoreductase n=1 Tax=Candidatus Nitronauta litoralis TaxID=2705533 RepID=A0A7T0G0F5_9BACT|nr:MAG: NAD(P)H-dependent oxidoreductase [Candidatus Nitronauta litoralis]